MNIGIFYMGPGVGDAILVSALPENYFKNTGFHIIDLEKYWAFDYNPYILRDKKPDLIVDIRLMADLGTTYCRERKKRPLSMQEKLNEAFNLKETFLRHSRLYRFEDSKTILNKITVQTQGKTIGGKMPLYVIEQIKKNYGDYEIFQVGGKNDLQFNGVNDLRGLNFWDTCQHIAESAIFIGIDSCCIHISDAYPKVRTKFVINYTDEKVLRTGSPMSGDFVWWEYNRETYNIYDRDIGVSMSYLKI